jgi:hypothetical protein
MNTIFRTLTLLSLAGALLLPGVTTNARERITTYVEPYNGRFQPLPDAPVMDHVLLNLIALHPQVLDDDESPVSPGS